MAERNTSIPVPGHRRRRVRAVALGVAALTFSPFALCEPATDTPHFAIRQYLIEGNTRVPAAHLQAAVAGFTGENKDFTAIESAVDAIRKVYKSTGYEAIQVSIPRQEIDEGVVRLQVIEATLGRVLIQGNQNFDNDNLRHALPALQIDRLPNIDDLGVNLRLANESFARQAQVTFRQGDDPRTVEAVVNVADDRPWHAAVSLDNTGSEATGDWRLGLAYMNANVFNRDHNLSAQAVSSPGHWGDVKIFGLNYRIPFYGLGGSLEFSTGYSSVNSGTVNTTAGSYGISGSGHNFGVHYVQLLPRVTDWDQRINVGVDDRFFSNDVTLQGGPSTSLVPDTEIHPVSIAYTGLMRQAGQTWGGSLSLHHNLPGGRNGDSDAIRNSRSQADASYNLLRYNLHYTRSLPGNWSAHAELEGQYTDDALISGEQFGIGGTGSVRGFHEREISNDYGHRGSVELQSPDLGRLLKSESIKLNALAFYDFAVARRNHAEPEEATRNHLSSAGFGLRGSLGRYAHLRLDVADVLDGGGVRKDGEGRVHLSLMLLY